MVSTRSSLLMNRGGLASTTQRAHRGCCCDASIAVESPRAKRGYFTGRKLARRNRAGANELPCNFYIPRTLRQPSPTAQPIPKCCIRPHLALNTSLLTERAIQSLRFTPGLHSRSSYPRQSQVIACLRLPTCAHTKSISLSAELNGPLTW